MSKEPSGRVISMEAYREAATARDIAGLAAIGKRLAVANAATLAMWRQDCGDEVVEALLALARLKPGA